YRLKLFLPITDCKNAWSIGAAEKEIGIPILIDIAGSSTGPPSFNNEPDISSDIPEGAVALIAEQFGRLSIIDDEKIYIAAVIEIRWYHSHRVSDSIYLGGCCRVGELSV